MNILTASEAAAVLRVLSTDSDMLALLPLVDRYIELATGRDWTNDSTIASEAKAAARMLLTQWYENPGQQAQGVTGMAHGLNAALAQLEARALRYRKYEFTGCSTGYASIPEAKEGDQVIALVGIYGVSGDQSANFESVISQDGCIQKIGGGDLSENFYLVTLISARDAVT